MSRLQSYVLTVTRALLRRLLQVTVLKVIIVTHACLHCPPWVITREFATSKLQSYVLAVTRTPPSPSTLG